MKLAGAPPLSRLAPLAAAVLAAHLLALQFAPDPLTVEAGQAMPTFTIRAVAPAPAAIPAPAAPAPPQAEAQRQPAPRPRAVTVAPVEPAAVPAPPREVAQPAEPAVATAPPAAVAPAGVQSRATAIPGSARMQYEVEVVWAGQVRSGQADLQWRHDGSQYQARMELTGANLTRVQTSTGRITAEGLAPSRFSDKRGKEEATHFDRDKGKVVFSNNKPEADLQAGAQDRLSVMLQLAAMAGGDPAAFAPGRAITVQTADTRGAEPWTFTVVGEEELQLPGGARRALKLQRMPRKEYDYKLELWLAPGMDYAPVRLRLTYPNGDSLDQRWASTDKG